jgi:hypothetical protein
MGLPFQAGPAAWATCHCDTLTDVERTFDANPREHSAPMTKRILSAIAEVLPDDGHHYLTEVDIRPGWGDVLNVHLHTTMPHTEAGREFGKKLRDAIAEALEGERHFVEIVWGARDTSPR